MSTAAPKSPITHPVAKRFMVVFAAVLLIGIVMGLAYRTDVSDFIVFIGAVGFLSSGLIASDKTAKVETPPRNLRADIVNGLKDIKDGFADLFAFVVGIGGVILSVVIALAVLWGLIAIVKWMWIHS